MAKRVDDNQMEIVKAFRQVGATVHIASDLGHGFPDLVVGLCDSNYLVEVKDGKKPPSRQKLTEDEEKFHQMWKGQVCIIRSVDDVLNFVKSIRKF